MSLPPLANGHLRVDFITAVDLGKNRRFGRQPSVLPASEFSLLSLRLNPTGCVFVTDKRPSKPLLNTRGREAFGEWCH